MWALGAPQATAITDTHFFMTMDSDMFWDISLDLNVPIALSGNVGHLDLYGPLFRVALRH